RTLRTHSRLSPAPSLHATLPIYSEGTIVRYEGREIIMIGSNNYLGLTNDPRVIEASKKAIDDFGSSVTGSRFMNGSLAMHRELRSEEHTSELQSRENLV